MAEYDDINVKFGLPEYYEDADKMDKLMQRQAELQDIIDATDAWNMDSKLDRAMAALNCPPGDWSVETLQNCGWTLREMPEGTPMTDYEARFTQMGLPIHRIIGVRP